MKLFILLTSVILIGSTAFAGKTEVCVQRVINRVNELQDKNPTVEVTKPEIRAILIREDRACQMAVIKVVLQAGQAMARISMGPADDDEPKEPSKAEIILTLNDILSSSSEATAASLPPPSAGTQ